MGCAGWKQGGSGFWVLLQVCGGTGLLCRAVGDPAGIQIRVGRDTRPMLNNRNDLRVDAVGDILGGGCLLCNSPPTV